MSRLTPKQETFVQIYLECGNASAAYRASYRTAAMKPATINRKAKELLDNGKITARIESIRAEKEAEYRAEAKRQGIAPEDIVREQALVGFFDPRHLFDEDGRPLPLSEVPDQVRRGLKTYKTRYDDDGSLVLFEYRAGDKLKALRDIGEHLGMYRQKHEHTYWDRLQSMTLEELKEEIERLDAEYEETLQERERLAAETDT